MTWTIAIEYDSVWMTFSDECPLSCVKQLLTSAIQHDHHELELFEKCFELMERIQDDPQDEYRIVGGDMSDRWTLVLKPSAPAGWDKVETSVPDTTVYDGTPVDLDTHEFTDDCEQVQSYYVQDDDGRNHGPYDTRDDAEHHADLINGIVIG